MVVRYRARGEEEKLKVREREKQELRQAEYRLRDELALEILKENNPKFDREQLMVLSEGELNQLLFDLGMKSVASDVFADKLGILAQLGLRVKVGESEREENVEKIEEKSAENGGVRKIIFAERGVQKEEKAVSVPRKILVEMAEHEEAEWQANSELVAELLGLEAGKFGIGVHNICSGSELDKMAVASSIMATGLNLNNGAKTILSTAVCLGESEQNCKELAEEIMGYNFGGGSKCSLVLAMPRSLTNLAGEKLFLGYPERNLGTAGQQYEPQCILDLASARRGSVPEEFILGGVIEIGGRLEYVKNENFYGYLSEEKKEAFFEEMSQSVREDFLASEANEAVKSGDSEKLVAMGEVYPKLAQNSLWLIEEKSAEMGLER